MPNILVVDDSVVSRDWIIRILHDEGFSVSVANSPEKGLEFFYNQEFDLVILDIELGDDVNGFDICERIRNDEDKDKSRTPVVFVTVNDTVSTREKGFEVGATDFVTKANLHVELRSTIMRLLDPEKKLNGLKAVIVDDQKIPRFLLTAFLEREGILVKALSTGEDVLVELQRDTYDLIIVDHVMKEMSGVELTEKIRATMNYRMTPIFLISGRSKNIDVLNFFRVGGTDYLTKPIIREELVARISVHLSMIKLNKKLADYITSLEKVTREKDKFLAVVTHDLRNPLTAVVGYAEMLLHQKVDEGMKRDLKKIQRSSRLLEGMVNHLLEYSVSVIKDRSAINIDLDIAEIVADSCMINTVSAREKGINITYENSLQGTVMIDGVAEEILRIFNNTLSNAIKFTDRGGLIRVIIQDEGEKVKCIIKDNGRGMSLDVQEKIFLPMKTGSAGTEGEKSFGLGFSIVKNLVELNKGTLGVNSKEGEGTEIIIEFPFKGDVKSVA